MTKFTSDRLAELRAVAEAAEPMMVFGGLAQTTFVSMEKSDVLALIAALEAKTAEVDDLAADPGHKAAKYWKWWQLEQARADRAEAALERVRELHERRRAYADDWDTCTCGYDRYPCPTIQAIEGADDE